MSVPVKTRVRALRERRKALGLVRVEAYVLPEHVAKAKKYLAKLQNSRQPLTR